MNNYNQQRGMATLLLVLLIGISVMLITATVAKTLVTKKESSVASHAQTNAQLMGWAGVSAFREYLLSQGKINALNVSALQGQNITLRSDANQKEIIAKNIQVIGCTVVGGPCTVTADISSNNLTAQAATTIHATYDLNLFNAPVPPVVEQVQLSFTGSTEFSGTTLSAEVPNTKVSLNVAGNVSLLAGFKMDNISELTINAKGNVLIDCTTTKCSNTKINVNTTGRVDLLSGGVYGDVRASGEVSLAAAAGTTTKVNNIYSRSNVYLSGNSSAQLIRAVGKVTLTAGAEAGDIYANAKVSLSVAKANNIFTTGAVELLVPSTVNGNVESGEYLYMLGSLIGKTTEIKGYAKVTDYVDMVAGAKIYGNVYAKGRTTVGTNNAAVRLSTSWIGGNVYANHNIRFLDISSAKDIEGNVYLTGNIVKNSIVSNPIKGSTTKLTSIPELNFTISSFVNSQNILDEINGEMNFETKVDVRVYKLDANYIFTANKGDSRIYLNHLKNKVTGLTYVYQNNEQYVKTSDTATPTKLNNDGFAIGKYTYLNVVYNGAICETVNVNNICTSQIVGYLPRVSMGTTLGFTNDYDFTNTSPKKTWYIRTTSKKSSLDNAAFAPGIFYFEGNVEIAGYGNVKADSTDSAFTNTFLAEGDLNAIAASPLIYSPYNVLREKSASIICDRGLKTVDNVAVTSATTPITQSNTYLIPTNLCKDAASFKYNMNRDESTSAKSKVTIDGKEMDKLDLGYVALMGNQVVRVGACARVFGDIYSRGTIETSAACGLTDQKNSITGSLSSQGEAPYIDPIKQHNTFGAGTKVVVPNPIYTSAQTTTTPGGTTGLVVDAATLQWSKYK